MFTRKIKITLGYSSCFLQRQNILAHLSQTKRCLLKGLIDVKMVFVLVKNNFFQWCPASRQRDQPRQHETGSNGVCEATARRQHVRARPRQTRPAQGLPSPQQLQASGQLQSKVKLFMNFLGNVGFYCTSIMPERRSRTAIFPLILTPQSTL